MIRVALIGASNKPSLAKRLFFRLQDAGYTVSPINPNCPELGGNVCFSSLDALSEKPDVVVFMVNPKVSLQALKQVVDQGIKKVWFQPDTFDQEVLDFCYEHHLEVEYEKCLFISSLLVFEAFVQGEGG